MRFAANFCGSNGSRGALWAALAKVLARLICCITPGWTTFVREAGWLTGARAIAVSRVMLCGLLCLAALIPLLLPGMRVGWDFGAFWTASRLAVSGHAEDAYGLPGQLALAALLGSADYPAFFYPPTALLIWLPFAAAPFTVGVALWLAVSLAAYAVATRAAFGSRFVIPALAFPAVMVCALYGQNALLSAALLYGAAATLESKPLLAGAFLGLLAYKPQLAILVPIALAAAGRWRAFAAAAATVATLVAVSAAAFGVQAWSSFLAVLPAAQAWNGGGRPGFDKFASFYAAIRLVGGSESVAWTVQAMAAFAAAGALILLARKRSSGRAEIAAIVLATGFCVPFLGDYDLVIFAVPGIWLAAEAIRTGWRPYERLGLALCYMAPFAIKPASVHGLPLAPVAIGVLAALVLRRQLLPRVVVEEELIGVLVVAV